MEGGYRIDVVFTSRLKRAIRSVWILLQELNAVYMPVFKSWRLNERKLGLFVTTLRASCWFLMAFSCAMPFYCQACMAP
jgi:bisphosphoglycerate-dependent phosphoglycerate mutase